MIGLPWRKSAAANLEPSFSKAGIQWALPEDKVRAAPTWAAAARYLEQLAAEGLASGQAGVYGIAWSQLYRLLHESDHQGGLRLLSLPAVGDWVPRLASRGTPSDPDFSLWIEEWISASHPGGRPSLLGGLIEIAGERLLLACAPWALCEALDDFQGRSPSLEPSQRMHALGVLQVHAEQAGALLDDYLSRTRVLSPERVQLTFDRSEALGDPVVELKPGFENGPEGFLTAFDRYAKVQPRYDVPTAEGGLVHVAPNEAAQAALSAIKAIPGRRVASDEARLFLHNPFAVLGDEARDAIDEDQLIQARAEARLLGYRLETWSEESSHRHVRFVPGGESDVSEDEALDVPLAERLLQAAERSRARGLPLFTVDGREVELTPASEAALSEIADWLSQRPMAELASGFDAFFRLDDYSERVVGFDQAAPQVVPYIAKKSADQGWLPDNIERGVAVPDASGVGFQRIELGEREREELQQRVSQARAAGQAQVSLPGHEHVTLPTEHAERLLVEVPVDGPAMGRPASPRSVEKPKPSTRRAALRILHNLDALDYGSPSSGAGALSLSHSAELPKALREDIRLLPHQLQGLAWMQARLRARESGIEGCLLADDMGLGKTLQSLALMAWYHETHASGRPCLVVAPVSLLQNWRAEVRKFLTWSGDDVLSLYGDDIAGHRMSATQIPEELRNAGVRKLLRQGFESGRKLVLTTYETLRDLELSIARVHWGVVVCDEAQKIKNPAAFVTQAAKALHADFRIACTGTPVENSLADLWCLFDFFQPGSLSSLADFTRAYRRAIETRTEGHEQLVEQLRRGIDPWVLRRMKFEVTRDLPRKLDPEHPETDPSTQRLRMSTPQARLYEEAVTQYRTAREEGGQGNQILALLQRLRTICAHPAAELRSDHETLSLREHLQLSPKLAWLVHRLEEIRARGDKAIVFSEFRDVQRLIQRAVSEVFAIDAPIINGSTSVDAEIDHSRQRIIDRFQAREGFGVLVLSTTAVGFGVNIQAANHVIHFTRPWNPAKEDQATDRAYRIGQTKDVYVYCPTVVGDGYETFEQRLDALLGRKRSLSRDMLAGVQEMGVEEFDGI